MNRAKLAVLSHSEPLQWGKIGKVANRAKLAVLSHSEPLRWEKIGEVVNQVKLAIRSHSEPLLVGKHWKSCELGKIGHSEPLRLEKIGKVANGEKLAILSHSEPKCHVDLRSLQFVAICDLRFALVRFTDSGWLSTAARADSCAKKATQDNFKQVIKKASGYY